MREMILDRAYELGFKYEGANRGCSQCLAASIQDLIGFDDAVFKAASNFAGGIALTTEGPCGALAAGIIVIGYLYGRGREDFHDISHVRRADPLVRAFMQKFIDKYGTFNCRDIHRVILGRTFRLYEPLEMQAFDAQGAHVDKCTNMVGQAARWLMEILLDNDPSLVDRIAARIAARIKEDPAV